MYLVRELMYCKPGKVRPLVEKFHAMNKLMAKSGQGTMRIMTDVAAEQYWTVVTEYELESLDKLMSMESMSAEDMKEMEEIMKGYHDLVLKGKREVFKLEA